MLGFADSIVGVNAVFWMVDPRSGAVRDSRSSFEALAAETTG